MYLVATKLDKILDFRFRKLGHRDAFHAMCELTAASKSLHQLIYSSKTQHWNIDNYILDATARGADKRIEIQAHVLRHLHAQECNALGSALSFTSNSTTTVSHHFIAVKAAAVDRVTALELAQFFDSPLFLALFLGTHGVSISRSLARWQQ